MFSAVALLLASSAQKNEVPTVRELHVVSVIPGPSKTRFDIYVNGKRVDEVKSSRKFDLTSHLRAGSNRIDVRYDAWNSKFSLLHPSKFDLYDGPSKESRRLLSVRAHADNPRGTHRIKVRFEPSTRR
ncbi:hypothetical protein EON82_09620 [bacterium]|nr:MAG: hypothetical protein EON82_09620 [bacterium]